MIKVLEHMDNVRWRYVCRGCASLLEFGAEDVTDKIPDKCARTFDREEFHFVSECLECPVCGFANGLPPSWKFKCERVSPWDEPPETDSLFRWKDATEELPTKSGEYFVRNTRNDWTAIMPFSAKHQLFNVFDHWSAECVSAIASKVTHWAEIPNVPEGAQE